MASELEEFFSECFDSACETIGQKAVRCGTRLGNGIVSPFVQTREQRDSGFWQECTTTLEVSREVAQELQLADRSLVKIESRDFRVMRIEDDPHDVSVRYFLKPA